MIDTLMPPGREETPCLTDTGANVIAEFKTNTKTMLSFDAYCEVCEHAWLQTSVSI